MLDPNHPRTTHIFTASRLEDGVLDGAKQIVAARPAEREKILAECERRIEEMRRLNSEHFHSSPSITKAIDEFQAALRALAADRAPLLEMILPALERLRSDDGFGTGWI
jgi:hypothetical protein